VCATQGEPLGDRLVSEDKDESGTVLVNSLGAVSVELTRLQLRAIVSALWIDRADHATILTGFADSIWYSVLADMKEEQILSICREILDSAFPDSVGHVIVDVLIRATAPMALIEVAAKCGRGKRSILPDGSVRIVIDRLVKVGNGPQSRLVQEAPLCPRQERHPRPDPCKDLRQVQSEGLNGETRPAGITVRSRRSSAANGPGEPSKKGAIYGRLRLRPK
jgi:hypothetical protein